MLRQFSPFALALAAAALVYVSGCNQSQEPHKPVEPSGQAVKPGEAKKDGEHGHKPGAHGGIIVEIGRDNYHAEAVFEGGRLRLYTLGKDEARVQEVETQDLTAYGKSEGGNESVEFVLKPTPQPGDGAGKTSRFIGELPKHLQGKKVEVTIPSIRINGERFRIGFASSPADHEAGMPAGLSGEEEKNLYLKPGGIYTAADIKANGNMTASERFRGLRAKHDMRPKSGDKICPVTFTKANPQFSWVVAGKNYEFCCPPCVDEFVSWAKEQPELVKEPNEYVKK